MYTTDSESHTLSVTRLLGDEKEQLKKNFTVYISSGSRTDETSFLKIQTHNTTFMLSSTCLAILLLLLLLLLLLISKAH